VLTHRDVVTQREGCVKLLLIVRHSAACAQAVVDADGVAVVVAALQAHPSGVSVQQPGCAALSSITHFGAACAQAVVDAGGVAAVVTALQAHPSEVGVQGDTIA